MSEVPVIHHLHSSRYRHAMGETPLYEQVRQSIAQKLTDGTYTPGDKLPSESRLAQEFGVNRLTVRRAIEELARAGAVESRQGSGTYVSASIIRLPLSQRLSTDSLVSTLIGQISEQGLTYEDILLGSTQVDNPKLNVSLELPPGRLWRVDNALVVNNATWMWSSSWFPRSLLTDPAANWDKVTGLYGQLNAAMGEPRPVWRAISADTATLYDAEILGIRASAPVLVRDGLTAGEDGEPLLRVSRRARMDRISYVLRYDQG